VYMEERQVTRHQTGGGPEGRDEEIGGSFSENGRRVLLKLSVGKRCMNIK